MSTLDFHDLLLLFVQYPKVQQSTGTPEQISARRALLLI